MAKNTIRNIERPNILSLSGGVFSAFFDFDFTFSALSSLMFAIFSVNPKNTMSIGLTIGPTGLSNITKHNIRINRGSAATNTVYIIHRSIFMIKTLVYFDYRFVAADVADFHAERLSVRVDSTIPEIGGLAAIESDGAALLDFNL